MVKNTTHYRKKINKIITLTFKYCSIKPNGLDGFFFPKRNQEYINFKYLQIFQIWIPALVTSSHAKKNSVRKTFGISWFTTRDENLPEG